MKQKKNLLVFTEIISNSEYGSENKVSTSVSILPLYTSLSPILPPQLPSPIDSPLFYNIMSQYNIN